MINVTQLGDTLFVKFKLVPLVFFLGIAWYFGFSDTAWKYGFYLGSIAGLLQIGYLLYTKSFFDRFALSVNLFLVLGGIAFLTNWTALLNAYETYTSSLLWLCFLLVAFYTTFFSKYGFIGLKNKPQKIIRKYSIYLLLFYIAGFCLKYIIKGYGPMLSIPTLIILKVLRTQLVGYAKKA